MPGLHGQSAATLGTTGLQDGTTRLSLHTLAKAVHTQAAALLWLISTLWHDPSPYLVVSGFLGAESKRSNHARACPLEL